MIQAFAPRPIGHYSRCSFSLWTADRMDTRTECGFLILGDNTIPRMPQIRYFKSRKAFYCQSQGHQYPLAKGPDDRPDGPTFKAAIAEFGRVIEDSR